MNYLIKFFSITFALISSFSAVNLFSDEGLIPIEYFACAPNRNSFSISPDGKHMLIINTMKDNKCDIMQDKSQPVEDEYYMRGMMLLDLETMESKVISRGSAEDGVTSAGWLNNDRIWYRPRYKQGQGIKSVAVFAVNLDGTKRKLIRQHESFTDQFQIYNYKMSDPEIVFEMNNQRRPFVYDYYQLNVYTGKKKLIARGPDFGDMKGKATLGQSFYPDGMPMGVLIDDGLDRIMYEYNPDTKDWVEHFRFQCQKPGFVPIGTYKGKVVVSGSKFSPSGDLIEENDTNALYFYDMETKEFSNKLYQDPDYDVSGLTGSCRPASGGGSSNMMTSELEYVSYSSLKPERVYFDKEAEQIFATVQSVFPDDFVSITTSSADRKIMVVFVSNSNNPGDYYLVNLNEGSVKPLFSISPWLDRNKLVKSIPVKYTARDGLEIPALLTLTKKKTDKNYFIIMPHGGPNTKQRIGYDSWAQFLVNRGINILQPDFRGSTGNGASHYIAGNTEWGKKMQDDLTDGVKWAIENGYADKDRVCIAGASYGGYATMAGLVFTPDVYRCGINAIGVTDMEQLLNDYTRRSSILSSWDEEPLLEWGNMRTEEGRAYAEQTSPLNHVDNIQAPLLILQGSNDPIVEAYHAEDLIKELKRKGKTYEAMFQTYEGHCVTYCGEKASLEYLDIQEKFLAKYLMN